jgi:biofilm PGA synthesis N-glycosyltransferase PgaC
MMLNFISSFVFFYPLAMSIVWMIGGLYFWLNYELKEKGGLSTLKTCPPISILVPCHNEAKTIELTLRNLSSLAYDNYQVIFIDDASQDHTADIIRAYTAKYPYFHLLRLQENQGKAGALNTALRYVTTSYVLVLDADTIVSGKTLKWLVLPFTRRSDLGAVTANPLPMNRDCFLSKLQTAEFMSIIGLIKRTQGIIGYFFTITGCATLFKTEVLRQIGGFSSITATEDIDVTWRIQKASYKIWFQPQAVAFIQVPNRLRDFWKQRKRWAAGGWHLLRSHRTIFCHWKFRHLWLLFLDFTLAYSWAFCLISIALLAILSFIGGLNLGLKFMPFPHYTLAILIYLLQSMCALRLNSFYDRTIKKCFIYIPWYPLFFFLIGAVLIVWTAPKSLFGSLKDSGKWSSPGRLSADSLKQGH